MIAKWDITSVCNLHCKHCCTGGQFYQKETESLSFEEVRDAMHSLHESGIREVQFTGGEPLLRPDLPAILEITSKLFDKVYLNTNGLLMRGDWLARERLEKFARITFSLDGPDRETHERIRGRGTFDPLVENVRATVAAIEHHNLAVEIHFNSILSRRVVDRARDFIALTKELGAQQFAINQAVMTENAKRYSEDFNSVTWKEKYAFIEDMVEAAKEYDVRATFEATPLGYAYINYKCNTRYRTAFHCGATRSGFYVKADGEVHPCMRSTEDMTAESRRNGTGNLREHSLEEIVQTDYFREFAALEILDQKDLDPCYKCKFRDHCSACRFEYAKDGKVEECLYLNEALENLVKVGAQSQETDRGQRPMKPEAPPYQLAT